MKFKIRICLVSVLLLPMVAFAGDWTKAQQEVLAFEEACVTTKDADDFIACFHEDFVGWGQGSTFPTTKTDRLKFIADGFGNFDSETLLFKPLSVIVKGNMAVVTYVQTSKTKNNATDEVEYSTQRWTDVCLKEDGKWTWISDHGVEISGD
jgi:ketosteroid isomerase-like protein